MATIQPIRPDLNEERLKSMQVRASKVWRGEQLPKQALAEDVLHLIAEVRLLRQKLQEKQEQTSSLGAEVDGLFAAAANTHRSAAHMHDAFRAKSKPSATKPRSLAPEPDPYPATSILDRLGKSWADLRRRFK